MLAACLVVGNSLLWYHNNTLLFFCKGCLPLSNTGSKTIDSKNHLVTVKYTASANTLADWTHTSHGTPSAGLCVLFEEYMNLAFVFSQRRAGDVSNVALIKKCGVQTRSQLAGIIGRCAVRSSAVGAVALTVRPTIYICARKTAIPWLQSVTTAWLKGSPLSFVQLSCHLSLFTVSAREHNVHQSHTRVIQTVLQDGNFSSTGKNAMCVSYDGCWS